MPEEHQEHCFSLLDDPLLRIRNVDGNRSDLTLPAILAGLATDAIIAFEALRPHQRQAWYSFLVQLAVLAMTGAGRAVPPVDPSEWRKSLVALTDGDMLPWHLIVADVSRPAFMQPPVPEGTLEDAIFRADVPAPDDLDILLTSKNHDIKKHRLVRPRVEHWIYALVSLQTMEGFLGQGNYGIARMNGGFGSRPLVGMTPELGWGVRFQRDVAVIASAYETISQRFAYDLQGPALLWLLPWNGMPGDSLPLNRCNPLYIEVCRRIRLTYANGAIQCWRANTKSARIVMPENSNGITGDPWTPIDKQNAKALTISRRGFSYDLLQRILFTGEYAAPAAMEATHAEASGAFLTATALARGQGQTDGWHDRVVPVPTKAINLLRERSGLERLATRAQEQVDTASVVQREILSPSLRALLNAGSTTGKVDFGKISRWMTGFDADVDEIFFESLWESLALSREDSRRRWQQHLFDLARRQLEDAIESSPVPSIKRYRAISTAESIFYGAASRKLDALFSKEKGREEEHDPAATD